MAVRSDDIFDADETAFLKAAFTEVFGTEIRGAQRGYPGRVWWIAEKRDGVQWNAWIDADSHVTYLAVNLEGIAYVDWPIARLIRREIEGSELFTVVGEVSAASDVEVVWRRDVWEGPQRLEVKELYVAPTPIGLSALTPDMWSQALVGARACLNPSRGHAGRALSQAFTLLSGKQELHDVSPHLQFRYRLWQAPSITNAAEGRSKVIAAREILEPLHRFAVKQSA